MKILLRNSPYFWLNIVCYYLLPVMVGAAVFFSSERYEISVEMGEKAWLLLLVMLFMKPISQILPGFKFIARSLPFRKQLGVAMFWLVIGHGVGTGIDKGLFSLSKLTNILSQADHYLFWGILAGVIVFILLNHF